MEPGNLLGHEESKELGDWMKAARVGDDDEVDGGDGEEEDAQHSLLHRLAKVLLEVGGVGKIDHHHDKVDVVGRWLTD